MFLEKFAFVDLTHSLTFEIPTWNGSCGFCLEVKKDYDQMFCVQKIKMHAGIGTHMDAPSHRFEGAMSIGDISLENLIVPACVIDVSKKAHADYEVSVDDIQNYETEHGKIMKNSLVIAHTGWGVFWHDVDKYRNVDAQGQMHFPAFSNQAAELLMQRDIAGIAIDTLSPDCLDSDFSVHKTVLGKGKYIIENIAGCEKMPPKGGFVIALPLKIQKGAEAPLRIIGLVPK